MREKRLRKKIKPSMAFVFLLIIQMTIMVFWGNAKQGFFVDELWSYGLANSYYFPHIFSDNALEGKWVDGEFFSDYIEVQEGERFRYGSVVYNLKNDAHPPIYFMVLHTICSLFPESFSKWYGLIPNMCYFLVAQVLLYRLSRKTLKNNWLALLPCVVWGCSSAAISFVLFIRMYMLSTMCGLLTLNLHMDLMENKKEKEHPILMWWIVILVSFFGYMCHYFYFIFAFFLSAFYMLYLLVQRKWKKMVWYASAMGGSLLLTEIFFPAAYKNLFGNGYTLGAVNNFGLGRILKKLYQYTQAVEKDLFVDSFALLWISFGIAMISVIVLIVKLFKNKEFRHEKASEAWFFGICAGTLICYFALASYMSPYFSNRYVSAIYPLIYFLLIWLVYMVWGGKRLVREKVTAMLGIVLIGIALWSQMTCVDFVYEKAEANIPAIEPYMDADVYFITFNYYKVTEKLLELKEMERVRVLAPEAPRIEEAVAEHEPDKEYLLVYVDSGEGMAEMILDTIVECSEYTQYKPVEGYEWLYGGACMPYVVY